MRHGNNFGLKRNGNNVKAPFTLLSPTNLIARAKFSSRTLRNAHGRFNLLSLLALRIREILLHFMPMQGGGMEIKMKKKLNGVRSKQILVSALAVLVIVAGYYRWSTDRSDTVTVMNDALPTETGSDAPTAEPDGSDYFAKARYERDCARSEATDLLKVSAKGDGDKNASAESAEKLARYAEITEKETAIENLVKAKGYSDCVAFVEDEGVRVVVKSDKLDAEGVAKIKDIVVEQTGVKATGIKISSKEK